MATVAAVLIAAGPASAVQTPYSEANTVTCLKRHSAVMGRILPTNRRLRAMRDLAQKTSVQARLRGVVIALAFGRSTSDASLLYELLQVPKDPLRLEQQRNVVLLSPKTARAARTTVLGCLRT